MDVRPCAERNEFAHGKETGIDGARTKTVLYHILPTLSRVFYHFFYIYQGLLLTLGEKSMLMRDLSAKKEKNRQSNLDKEGKEVYNGDRAF